MRRDTVAALVTLSATLLSPTEGRPDSLAAAAAREKARKKGTPAKVFGEDDLKASKGTIANADALVPQGQRQVRLLPGGGSVLVVFEGPDYPPLAPEEVARIRRDAPSQGVLARLASRDPVTSAAACRRLEESDLQPHTEALFQILGDASAPSGARQCLALLLSARAAAMPRLPGAVADAMKDHDPHLRRVATLAAVVAAPNDQRLRGLLAEALRDPAYDVRTAAAYSLSALGPDASFAVPALIQSLVAQWPEEHPNKVKVFRVLVAGALGEIGPAARAAIPALTEALMEQGAGPRHDVGAAARVALTRIRQ